MFESIVKNIATVIFLACAMLVGSIFPKEPDKNESPSVKTEETGKYDSSDHPV